MAKFKMFACDNYTKKISDALSKYRSSYKPPDFPTSIGLFPPGSNRLRIIGTAPAKREDFMPETDTKPISAPPPPEKLNLVTSFEPGQPLIYKEAVTHYAQNMRDHHTDSYSHEESGLVLRRGQYFNLEITFDRHITATDLIGLVFQVKGMDNPQFGNGTFVLLRLTEKMDSFNDLYKWGGYIASVNGKSMAIVVRAACDCPVTEWQLSVTTRLASDQGNKDTRTYFSCFITFLFNPWCKDDPVYHSDEAARQEYILNRRVIHYPGESGMFEQCEWELGQFEEFVLRGALVVLQKWVQIDPSRMGCPVEMCRSLLAGVCKVEKGKGILDCQNKTTSAPIYDASYFIKEAVDRGHVLPGQSFTCAAVLASLCRSLGLPCRLITAFNVACLNNNYRTEHIVFDEEGKLLWANGKRTFHCWVDIWMKRPDLCDNNKYDGWQAIDIYGGGPCPILAIKHNLSVKPYDSDQFHAMLNADSAIWRYTKPKKDSPALKLIWYVPCYFGKKIVTKAIGSGDQENLTKRYKMENLPTEEDETVKSGLSPKENPYKGISYNPAYEDVTFQLVCKREPLFGETVKMNLVALNTTENDFHIEGVCQAFSQTVDHTDQVVVHKLTFKQVLKPNKEAHVWLDLGYEHYKKEVQSYRHMVMVCSFDIVEVGHTYYKMFRLHFKYPKVVMDYTRGPRGEMTVNCALNNILPIALKNVQLMFLCTRWKKTVKHTFKDLQPHQEIKFMFTFDPGDCRVVVLTASLRAKDINSAAEHIFITD